MNARIHWSGHGAAVHEAIALEQIQAVVMLREVQSARLAIPDDLDTKVVGPRLRSLKCLASSTLSAAILDLDLDAKVMLSTKTGQMTCTPSFSQMKMEPSAQMWAKPS
jgi:hypothetical protein